MGKGAINLHGHSHGRLKPLPRQLDVGVDAWDFRPVRLEQVLASAKSTRRAARDFDRLNACAWMTATDREGAALSNA